MYDLTVLVLTCNRPNYVKNAIASVEEVFGGDVKTILVVNDISSKFNRQEDFEEKYTKNFKSAKLNLDIIDARNQIMTQAIAAALSCVTTSYVLVLEDDDVLINGENHRKIAQELNSNCEYGMIGFNHMCIQYSDTGKMNIRVLPDRRDAEFDSVDGFFAFPDFWNGHFQFGSAYFRTEALQSAFNDWFTQDDFYYRAFDTSNDEALALWVSLHTKTKFCDFTGYSLGQQGDNLSWGKDAFFLTMYSARTYLFALAEHAKAVIETPEYCKKFTQEDINQWGDKMIAVILRELQSMTDEYEVTTEMVFENYCSHGIEDCLCTGYKLYNLIPLNLKKDIARNMRNYLSPSQGEEINLQFETFRVI